MPEHSDTSLTGTDATAPSGNVPDRGGLADVGTPGQRAQSGVRELERDQAAGGATADRGEGDAGPAGTPSYGASGNEGLGADGTASGRSHDPRRA